MRLPVCVGTDSVTRVILQQSADAISFMWGGAGANLAAYA